MTYLITTPNNPPFLTYYYDFINHFTDGMVVYNLITKQYSYDGKTFIDIEEDHL